MVTSDFLVIGGGIIGINIARQLKRRFSDATVIVIEKEDHCGAHASGRNSGVLHAGFYYSPESLKAKFTRIGNKRLTEYCESKQIPMNRCGKLVVAKDCSEHPALDELLRRGKVNDIDIQAITEEEAKSIEPRVKTCQRALFSPTTSTVDPTQVLQSMTSDAIDEGVQVRCGVQYLKKTQDGIFTSGGAFNVGYLINAAGLYADKIAKDFGFSENYKILPFKGLYLYSDEPRGAIRTNIYPVPDLRNPFLGVHVTVTSEGKAKIGPTAIPAFWREQYSGIENFSLQEFMDLTLRQMHLIGFSNFDFKKLALQELRKYSRSHLVTLASALLDGVQPEHYTSWGRPGIRAQLVNMKEKSLQMDFVLEGDDQSMHILNAVSPGFTCSIPFSEYVCERIRPK
ncbi:L-2-hydroxyglutarate oxidase [uncultured Nitrospira sp.]|uniref:L-2-hydroxyglutarate oxidase n=1 Tax=uncultured Nitrospira sp. TaxID=157176 RepID=UPI003140622F